MGIIYPKSLYTKNVINVKDFGATGDGSTDDTAAIQAAMDASVAGGANAITPVVFPPGKYYITSQIDLPVLEKPASDYEASPWIVSGYGATIYSDQDIVFFDYTPSDATERSNVVSYFSRVFEGLAFEGTNGTQKGLSVEACYTLTLRDLRFHQLGTGFEGRFVLAANLENCRARYCDDAGFSIQPGSIDSTNSTVCLFSNCRVFTVNGESTAYKTNAVRTVFVNCVSEGHHCKYHYDVGSGASLYDCHCECEALYAIRASVAYGSVLTVKNLAAQGGSYYFMDLSPSTGTGGGVVVEGIQSTSTSGSVNGPFGHPAYAGGTTYSEHDRVEYSGNVYRSKTDSNTGNQPDISADEWEDEGAAAIMRHTDTDGGTGYSPGMNFKVLHTDSSSRMTLDWLTDSTYWDSSYIPVYLDVEGPENANQGTSKLTRSVYTQDFSDVVASGPTPSGILSIEGLRTNSITITESSGVSLDDIQWGGGSHGGRLVVRLADGNVTVKDVSSGGNANFHLAGSTDFTPSSAAGAMLEFQADGGVWYEIARTDY